MSASERKLLVIQVAGLGHDFLVAHDAHEWRGLTFRPMETVFPAVTCPVQASFRTGLPPSRHGVIGNGLFLRELAQTFFWDQSAALITGPRIWDGLRARGRRVALLFWQQSLGESADIILSPAPIHRHHGGMVQDCYSKPAGLYAGLCRAVGAPFRLRHYWGPLASPRSSAWIAAATAAVMRDHALAPALCLTYLPALDYDLQRYGLRHRRSRRALAALFDQIRFLLGVAQSEGYSTLIFGDYAMAPVRTPVYPNLALRRAGFFSVRPVHGHLYPDLHDSPALAVVDHEVANVYVRRPTDIEPVQRLLSRLEGVQSVLAPAAQAGHGIAHPRNGELVMVAAEGHWFAYPWWERAAEEPDYARHVDIHRKPGYDPCELFFGWLPPAVSRNARRVRGSHGRVGQGRAAAWAATFELPSAPRTLLDLAAAAQHWMEQNP